MEHCVLKDFTAPEVLRTRPPARLCQETIVLLDPQVLQAYLVLLDSIAQVAPVRRPHARRWLETIVLLARLYLLDQLANRDISVLVGQRRGLLALPQLDIIVFKVLLVQLGHPAPKDIGAQVDRLTRLDVQQRPDQGTIVQVARPPRQFAPQGSTVQAVHRTKSLALPLLEVIVQLDLPAALD